MDTNIENNNEFENGAESENISTNELSNSNLTEENNSLPESEVALFTGESPTPEKEIKTVPATTAASAGNGGMSALMKGLAVIAVILAIGVGLLFWKAKVGGHEDLNRITAEDMQLILKDANPMQLKALASSPEQKKKIAENLKQLLAVASQARKEGIANDPNVEQELENIRMVITASIYDQRINKDKGPMTQFGYISDEQVNQFWGDGSTAEQRRHEAEFKKFIDSKLALARESGKFPKDKELTEEELKQAKEDFAKIAIYDEEAKEKAGELGEDFKREVELQTKLQQAQFLAGIYAQKYLVDKAKVTDEEVQKYIAAHPELNPAEKKAKAEEVLKRAQSGEDFAKLANEFSEDPGNKNPKGELQGGLYKDVAKGQMMPEFEAAALALEPGQIAQNLVETPYGFHIIKLERKGEGKDASGQPTETYDVRHILISTTTKDPQNPMGREMPISEMVRAKLEEEKQKQVLDEIVANNPVEVAEDFPVPQPSEEDLKQMQQQQQQMMQQQMQMQAPPDEADQPGPKGKAATNPAPSKK